MTNKIILNIGLFDKDAKVQIIDTYEAFNLINKAVLASKAYGATIWKADGIYMHNNGQIIKEPSICVEVIDTDNTFKPNLDTLIEFLKKELNQESIMVQEQQINVQFK